MCRLHVTWVEFRSFTVSREGGGCTEVPSAVLPEAAIVGKSRWWRQAELGLPVMAAVRSVAVMLECGK
jgi:hypothetical protein